MSRPCAAFLVVCALFMCGEMNPGLQADTNTQPTSPAPPAPSIDAARGFRPVERKLPPLGTKNPPKYDMRDSWPAPGATGAPSKPQNKPIPMPPPPLVNSPPYEFDDPYMNAGYGFRAPAYIKGPYLKSAQLKTLNHQGLLPSAVPTPAANYRRYFIFVQVMPAVSKIWVVAPKSVSPNLLFDHLMRLPYNKDMDRHTYVIQDHDYTVAMIVKDSTRFGLRNYRDTLPLDQILKMLQKQGIETPGIVRVSDSAQMLPALSPDQHTTRTNVYDLRRHPELGHMVVSVNLTNADYWPLLYLMIAPLFVVIVIIRLSRIPDLPDKERLTAAVRIDLLTMMATQILLCYAISASFIHQLDLYAMWFKPGLVNWAVFVPMVISLLIPIAGFEVLRNIRLSRLLDATDRLAAYPEVQRMRTQHMLVIVGGFIIAIALSRYWSGRAPYSIMPFVIFIPIFAYIGVLALLQKREDALFRSVLPSYTEDYKERLLMLQHGIEVFSPQRAIGYPDIQMINSLHAYREISVQKDGHKVMVSPRAFDTLNDDEMMFMTISCLLNDEDKWIQIALLTSIVIMLILEQVVPDSYERLFDILWILATFYGASHLVGIMRSRRADQLAVNLIGNEGGAISALRKMHEAAPGNRAIKARLRALEASAQTGFGRP